MRSRKHAHRRDKRTGRVRTVVAGHRGRVDLPQSSRGPQHLIGNKANQRVRDKAYGAQSQACPSDEIGSMANSLPPCQPMASSR